MVHPAGFLSGHLQKSNVANEGLRKVFFAIYK